MNIMLRELKYYRKQILYWSLGLLVLMMISMYKIQGMAATPGGIEALMKSLPPLLQSFFGSEVHLDSAMGAYRMVHLYIALALSLHAALLGSDVFGKEERDKTYEFLYVKGLSRTRVLYAKIGAGVGVMLVLDLVCVLGFYSSARVVGYAPSIVDIIPYISALMSAQCLFFSGALWLSVCARTCHYAARLGSGAVWLFFMITLYVKIGGQLMWVQFLSPMHYIDAAYIQESAWVWLSTLSMLLIALLLSKGAIRAHNRKDLL